MKLDNINKLIYLKMKLDDTNRIKVLCYIDIISYFVVFNILFFPFIRKIKCGFKFAYEITLKIIIYYCIIRTFSF